MRNLDKKPKWYLPQLPLLVKESYNLSQVIDKLGFSKSGDMYKTIQQYISQLNIDTSHWRRFYHSHRHVPNPCDKEVFILNSDWSNRFIRLRIIKKGIMPYLCAQCGISTWNGSNLSLQLDHINGNNRDNRLENLRLLCPNCHSQTENWGKKRKTNKESPMSLLVPLSDEPKNLFCLDCGSKVSPGSFRCLDCSNKYNQLTKPSPTKIVWPPLDELVVMVEKSSYLAVGKQLGVSDNCVRKHIKKRLGTLPETKFSHSNVSN